MSNLFDSVIGTYLALRWAEEDKAKAKTQKKQPTVVLTKADVQKIMRDKNVKSGDKFDLYFELSFLQKILWCPKWAFLHISGSLLVSYIICHLLGII